MNIGKSDMKLVGKIISIFVIDKIMAGKSCAISDALCKREFLKVFQLTWRRSDGLI